MSVRKLVPLEHDEQVTVIEWWAYTCKRYALPEFALYAIANAGAGAQKGQAGKMKAEGVRAGVPDLFLAVGRGRRHGLYIEMKRRSGSAVSESQTAVMRYLYEADYDVQIAEGAEEAIAAITTYLERR